MTLFIGESTVDVVSAKAQKEVERKLAKLRKRGALGANNAVIEPKVKSRKIPADPVRTAMFSKDAAATVLGTADAYNLLRAGGGAIKTATEHLPSVKFGPSGEIIGGVGAAVGVIAYSVGVGINAAKLDASLNTELSKTEAAAKDADEALQWVRSKGKQGSPEAYFRFVKATEPIIGPAGSRSSTSLDKQIYGGNIGRYLSSVGSSLSSLANSVAKLSTGVLLAGASIASGALSIVAGGFELAVASAQKAKVDAELKASNNWRRGLREWVQASRKDELNNGLNRALDAEAARRQKVARRASQNNKVSFAKGALSIAAGVAFIVVGGVATVATAGLILPIMAGVLTAGCLTVAVVQFSRESAVGKLAKREQRQAQALMATHKVSELKKMLRSTDHESRKCKVATVERKYWFSREKGGRIRTVDVGQNGYLARQIKAYDVAQEIGEFREKEKSEADKLSQNQWNGKVYAALVLACQNPNSTDIKPRFGPELLEMIQLLKANGKDTNEIVSICQQAINMSDLSACRGFLREQLASAMGAPWTAEKGVPAKALLGPLQELLDRERKAGREPDMKAVAKEFRNTLGKANYPKFVQAVRDELGPGVDLDSDLVWKARAILLYEPLETANSPDPARFAATSAAPQSPALETAKRHPELAGNLVKISGTGESTWDMPELPKTPFKPGAGHSRSQSQVSLDSSLDSTGSGTIVSLDSSGSLNETGSPSVTLGTSAVPSSVKGVLNVAGPSELATASRTRVPRSPRAKQGR